MFVAEGTAITFCFGVYADRRSDHLRVIRGFEQRDVSDEFRRQSLAPNPDPETFVNWLVEAGYVQAFPNQKVWHIGSYEFDPGIE